MKKLIILLIILIGGVSVFCSNVFATDAMTTYIDGSVNTPRFKTWNGAVWSAESDAPDVGGDPYWQVIRSAPDKNEKILGVMDNNQDINISTWTSAGGWTHIAELTGASGTTTKRPFDIAYEQSSGDIMIVYSVNTATPVFRVAGAGGWTAETKVFSMGANADIEWVRLEPNPGSDEIILVTQHADSEIWGQVWDGNAWGDAQLMETDIEAFTVQSFDIAYEHDSEHGLVVWTDNASATPQYRTWDGNSWSGEGNASSHGVTTLRWVKMASDMGSDEIIMATLDEAYDVNVQVWDGSAWGDQKEVEGAAPTYSRRCFDVAYSSAGNKKPILPLLK